jgi:hypothetical protein
MRIHVILHGIHPRFSYLTSHDAAHFPRAHVIVHGLHPRFLSYVTSHDAASTLHVPASFYTVYTLVSRAT